ncbi:hypothetical protein [Sporosarcina sp. D27]|uniref:hypothetical protein n=1 Tax=Sporosarcina sp. D27 TaxID=1382305 RepID=UPI00046ED196|nr:hypothetical protein [Sporosarcina sp. D27]
MEYSIQHYLKQLGDSDKTNQYEAFLTIQKEIEEPVDWAYEVWGLFAEWLHDKDPHKRARGAQFLAGLAKSDSENRILDNFSSLCTVAEDEKFVTSRHALQSFWKIALGGDEQKKLVADYLSNRFYNAVNGVHPAMIRSDIIIGLRKLFDATQDEDIRNLGKQLIEAEDDAKQMKKLKANWK